MNTLKVKTDKIIADNVCRIFGHDANIRELGDNFYRFCSKCGEVTKLTTSKDSK